MLRSSGQPELIYVLLTDAEAQALRDDLKRKGVAADLRRKLKVVLNGR